MNIGELCKFILDLLNEFVVFKSVFLEVLFFVINELIFFLIFSLV